jgi:hypothetical protein
METKKQLADFISNNNVIGVTAGVTIALVTKDVILSFVPDGKRSSKLKFISFWSYSRHSLYLCC